MSERRVLFLQKGFIGACALAALVLLASFYSTVSGAVDRAGKQRLASVPGSTAAPLAVDVRQAARASALLARVGD